MESWVSLHDNFNTTATELVLGQPFEIIHMRLPIE
jgi:hypothetical protein